MVLLSAPTLKRFASDSNRFWQAYQSELKALLGLAAIFFGALLVVSLHRHYTFYTSYDQGLFNQLFWNNLHGHWFQSSLTGANSVGALRDGAIPRVAFIHLGQHFVLDFVLWLPLYALFPSPVTLIVLQVGLMTAGGLVLYPLARHSLQPKLALWITASYFAAVAVIGPTLANFYEHCQIPLFTFGLLLAMEKRRWGWFWLLGVLVLGIREEAGFVSFGVGLYLLASRRHVRVGAVLCLVSFAYVVGVTNAVMPHFSQDNSRMYLVERFSQFVPGNPSPTTLQVLGGLVTHPIAALNSMVLPLDRKLLYLFGQTLPLAFVPLVSPMSWAIAGVPLLSLMIQSGPAALNLTMRYAIAVVPGLFYGAILWWAYRPHLFKPLRRFWIGCLAVSIVMAIAVNPNQAFYFLFPDSFKPRVYVSLPQQWAHSAIIRQFLAVIPPDASVSATTHVIPHLSTRREIIRLPVIEFLDDQEQPKTVEYLIADLWRLKVYGPAFKFEQNRLGTTMELFDQVLGNASYGLLGLKDGVALLQKGGVSKPEALAAWKDLRQTYLGTEGHKK